MFFLNYGPACGPVWTGSVHQLRQQRKLGGKFSIGLVKQPWGMQEMQIDDPYGNAIRFGDVLG
jgi:hypothetical protein